MSGPVDHIDVDELRSELARISFPFTAMFGEELPRVDGADEIRLAHICTVAGQLREVDKELAQARHTVDRCQERRANLISYLVAELPTGQRIYAEKQAAASSNAGLAAEIR